MLCIKDNKNEISDKRELCFTEIEWKTSCFNQKRQRGFQKETQIKC